VVSYGGGLVAGDAVAVSVRVAASATAVLATQASTKVYHARGPPGAHPATAPPGRPPAISSVAAAVGAGALLALLPDPVIAFTDARFRQRQSIALARSASLVLLDWCSSGRRARGEAWAFASYESRTEVTVAASEEHGAPQLPLLTDAVRLQASGASPLATRMGACHVSGVLILTGPRYAKTERRNNACFFACAAVLTCHRAPAGWRRTRRRCCATWTRSRRCASRARAAAPAPSAQGAPAERPRPCARRSSSRRAARWKARMLLRAQLLHTRSDAADAALPRMRAGPGGGCVIRFAAEEADAAYAWARAALAPLHSQLGGAPYRI
jgi:hypothetical protein